MPSPVMPETPVMVVLTTPLINLATGVETTTGPADHSTGGNAFLLTDDASPPAGTVMAIYSSATDMKFNVSASDTFDFSVNDVDQLTISDTTINLQNNISI